MSPTNPAMSPTNPATSAASTAQSDTRRTQSGAARGLIVHDDLDLRLKVADLLRRAGATRPFDTSGAGDFASLTLEAMDPYAAFFLILNFAGDAHAESLKTLQRLRTQAPRTPIFVIACGGSERSAVQAVKSGAMDYWPIHAVELNELKSALKVIDALHGERAKPRAVPAAAAAAAPAKFDDLTIPGYRFVKRLSKSEAGGVYLAESTESAGQVAVKLQRLTDASQAQRKWFLRECELLSKLNHRSVADVLDYGATPECCYLVLDYFPCGSLRDRLRNPINEADALNYAMQIADALCVVHAANIVHRDLKPSNLMLTDDNRLVMIDFGLARSGVASLDITHPSISVGSPYYVSPEQIAGQEPDVRCDLYSFGVVLYELLTGSVPFAGRSVAEILEHHRVTPVPKLPPSLRHYQVLIDRLLAKSPQDRYASAVEVMTTLRTFMATPQLRTRNA
jgi:ActR/RegA family two-component response regulator